MNMPMAEGKCGRNSRSFSFRFRMNVGGDALALCWWREEEGGKGSVDSEGTLRPCSVSGAAGG